MRKTRFIPVFMIFLLLFETLTPLKSIYGNSEEPKAQSKEKIYYQWMGHSYTRNETKSPILRLTKVDYNTGLFKNVDVVLDFIDTSKDYYFKKALGMNKKNPHIIYSVLKSGSIEKIIKYDMHKDILTVTGDLTGAGEVINEVYPDAGMYVMKNTNEEYLVYSLPTNKLIHKTKQIPFENSDTYSTNIARGNHFYPEPSTGALYFVPRIYFDSKANGYVTNKGEYSYELKPDGKKVKLHSYKEDATDEFVFKKKLSSAVIFKQSKKKDIIKHELIINGKARTLHQTNLKSSDYTYANAQFSPQGNYIVLQINFFENKKRVKNKGEYQVFDARKGTLVRKIPFNVVGSPILMDYRINWVEDTDHIIQSRMLNSNLYRTINSNLSTPIRSGIVVASSPYIYSFPLDAYLTVNDPIPVSFRGKYMHYSGQGTFRSPDNTTYTPIKELMSLLGGTVSSKNEKIIVTYGENSYTLNSKKQIVWENRTYYPIRELLSAFELKLSTKSNKLAADDWREFQIVQ